MRSLYEFLSDVLHAGWVALDERVRDALDVDAEETP